MNGKGVSQSVRTYAAPLTGLLINETGQTSFLGTLSYDLPGSVAIDAK
jgi:hypothetical protein